MAFIPRPGECWPSSGRTRPFLAARGAGSGPRAAGGLARGAIAQLTTLSKLAQASFPVVFPGGKLGVSAGCLGRAQADGRAWGSGPGPAGGSRAWRLEVPCISLTPVDGSVFLEVLRGSPCLLGPCQCRAWQTPVPSCAVTISTPELSFPSGQSRFDVSKCTDAPCPLRLSDPP